MSEGSAPLLKIEKQKENPGPGDTNRTYDDIQDPLSARICTEHTILSRAPGPDLFLIPLGSQCAASPSPLPRVPTCWARWNEGMLSLQQHAGTIPASRPLPPLDHADGFPSVLRC